MTLLGKFLIFLNILAAGGFVYLATQDWKGRQTINAAVVRHKLLLTGLPFDAPESFDPEDETPFQIEMAGHVPTDTISKRIVELHFQVAPGTTSMPDKYPDLGDKAAVPCQIAEVKRVKAKINNILNDVAPPKKVEILNNWLLEQSETYEQRLEVQKLVKDGNADELQKRLMALFDAVLAPPATASTESMTKAADGADEAGLKQKVEQLADSRAKPIDPAERQNRVVQLLSMLAPDDPKWQNRVIIVVGVRRYVNVVVAFASRYRDMSARLEKLIVIDQTAYLSQEANQLQMARERTEIANRQSRLKQEKRDELVKESSFLAQRKTQLLNIQTQLLKIKAEVDEALVSQSRIEAGLFEIQKEVAITLEQIYTLEDQLTAREQELLKLLDSKPKAP